MIITDAAALFSAVAAVLGGVAAIMSVRARNKVDEIHLQINSRMDKLLETTQQLGEATGREAQRSGNGEPRVKP